MFPLPIQEALQNNFSRGVARQFESKLAQHSFNQMSINCPGYQDPEIVWITVKKPTSESMFRGHENLVGRERSCRVPTLQKNFLDLQMILRDNGLRPVGCSFVKITAG